jgi:hypothetical protein
MILIGGPFIGSFEQEVLTFRPYLLWLMLQAKPEIVYVNTHANRSFLYDFILDDHALPVYEHISRNELGQLGYIHEDVDSKLFQTFVKDIKTNVCGIEDCSKRDLETYHLSYVRSTPHVSIYKKVFSPIQIPDVENPFKDKIVFIPHSSESREVLSKVKTFLKDYNDLVIAGDTRTRFRNQNVVLSMVDYYENGLKLLVKMISEAKAVVCPLSYWTTICNLQHAPVFSWGKTVGQHREGGIYHFNNKRCLAYPADDMNIVLHMLENFLEEVYNGKI